MERYLTGLRGWIEASHPFPLAAVVLLTGLVGLASSTDDVDVERLLWVMLAMMLSQFAIGWTNDFTDRHTDHRFQPSKPLAAGRIDERFMPVAIVGVLLGSLAIGVLLGPLPLLFLIIGTAAGLVYDLWLKLSRWSWLPFIVGFAALPPYVWSSLDLFRSELILLYPVGVSLVPAVHIANVLPDMAADISAKRRNLAVIFGREKALKVIAVCLLFPLLLVGLTMPFVEYDYAVLVGTVGVFAAFLLAAAACYWRRQDGFAFKAIVAASVLFTGGWLTAV